MFSKSDVWLVEQCGWCRKRGKSDGGSGGAGSYCSALYVIGRILTFPLSGMERH